MRSRPSRAGKKDEAFASPGQHDPDPQRTEEGATAAESMKGQARQRAHQAGGCASLCACIARSWARTWARTWARPDRHRRLGLVL